MLSTWTSLKICHLVKCFLPFSLDMAHAIFLKKTVLPDPAAGLIKFTPS